MFRRVSLVAVAVALLCSLIAPSVAAAAPSLSCGSPTHLTFDNAHSAKKNGYGTAGSGVQWSFGSPADFTNMSVWSPDLRLPKNAAPSTVQTMDLCSNSEWNATVTETDGTCPNCPRVVTYPSSEHRFTEYDGTCNYVQPWSSYSTLTSSWAIDAPAKGDWDESYDLWMGDGAGCSQPGVPQIELMIYTKWNQNIFAPSAMANFTTRDGNNYDAWWSWRANGDNCNTAAGCIYLQTRLTAQPTSGTVNLRQLAQKLYRNGYTYHDGTDKLIMPWSANLHTVQYGVEIVSGNHTVADGPITFHLTAFAVRAS